MVEKKEKKFRNRSLRTLWSRDFLNYCKSEAKRKSLTLDQYIKEREEVEKNV